MDWKYILSLTPEVLTEQNIEDLYSTLAWYDFESEVFNSDKYIAVLKLSQEIMKFKAGQVQTLLTELDEVAVKQGEEEIRKLESEADAKSSKSRLKSPISADYSDLDQKYVDLKSKYKQQSKLLEKFKRNTEELKIKLTETEQERDQLQLELQRAFQEGSQSDISESVREQQKELIETLHHKNKQISSLLKDLEESESEKTLLKEKLVQVKNELSDATQQLQKLHGETKAYKKNLEESSSLLEEIKLENIALKSQINELVEEKESYDRQIEEFTEEVNTRIDEWKRILDEKDEQIKQLQTEIKSVQPSSASTERTPKVSHTRNLNRILNERDAQIEILQKQLQDATKEMEETTDTLKRIALEKDTYEKRVNQFKELNTDLKAQLNNANEKCQQLQDDIAFLEKSYQTKSKDLQELISGLKGDESKLDLYRNISHIESLKAECLSKEKKIMNLVRASNKLQEAFDNICLENQAMRDKLGLQENDSVNISGVLIKYKKQKKALQHAQLKVSKLEDENIALKLNVQDINRKNSNLSKQILKGGLKPNVENALAIENDVEKTSEYNVELKALSEENEALRKGLHEILDGLKQKRKEPIQLTTLEKLLKALDVKHVAGWYHPAMRIQAELHSLQGVNSELREQLKQKESEFLKYKELAVSTFKTGSDKIVVSSPKTILEMIPDKVSKSEHGIVNVLNQHLVNILEIHKGVEQENSILKEKVLTYKADFEKMNDEIKNINENAKEQLKLLKEKVQNLQDRNNSVEEAAAVAESKLQEYIIHSNLGNDEKAKAQRAVELAANLAVLNRKCLYFEKQESDLQKEINFLKENVLTTENDLHRKSSNLSAKEKALKSKLAVAENELKTKVDGATFQETQNHFDELNVKYKKLLRDFENLCSENSLEIKILTETSNYLREEKRELQEKMKIALLKLHDGISGETESTLLAKKLAETEVNEITERQRANHIQNLYELVKEQLQKSEDRFREFEDYNKEIMHKNLLLQESLKDVQNKVANFVDISSFKEIQVKYTAVLKENEALLTENEKLKGDVKVLNSTLESYKHWSAAQEYEFLCLKHQVVDLQAATDDKTVIARLSSDVVNARLAESKMEQKVNNLIEELGECKRKSSENEKLLEEESQRVIELRSEFERRIGALKETISIQKQQYFGCVPLSIQEKFIEKLKQAALDKKAAFKSTFNAKKIENDCLILKEQLQKESQLLEELKSTFNKDRSEGHILLLQKECNTLKLENLKLKRSAEFTDNEIEQLQVRLNKQDEHIQNLEEELLKFYQDGRDVTQTVVTQNIPEIVEKSPEIATKLKLFISKQTQTLDIIHSETSETKEDGYVQDTINKLQVYVLEKEKEISERNNIIAQLKSKITELEMNVSLFRQQIGDRQSQITFYENHILELRGKIEKAEKIPTDNSNETIAQRNDEALALKATVNNLQAMLKDKDEAILNYQTLLKKDRDEHSLAAARMQDELRRLQHALIEQQKINIKIQETSKTEQHPSRAAIEQYILQVHQLESHTVDLHTTVASLTSQLQACREECVRWRTLANDRLETMEQLRRDLEEQHQDEITSYRKDSEKWQQEVVELKQLMCKFKMETSQVVPDINKVLKDKEDRIHELTVLLRQAKGEVKRNTEKDKDPYVTSKFNELLASKEQLQKEYQMLRGRYEQLLNKEKGARDEIRELKYQLMKRPTISSARSDKSDKSIKEQLQKKITTLEKELEEMKENLDKQAAFNETHKLKMNEDFEKWKKQKHWQQLAEKLKTKLKEKEDAYEKLQDTCNGYRILIQRLEREKHSLEARLKTFRITNPHTIHAQVENLRSENIKLQAEVEVLNSKLEISQHHSGGLGAAMLQEKLEAQERKIAVLELSAKGTVEIRTEVERLQNTVANLQKRNLCMEAENMELKLDLEKSAGDVPYMKEQIQHLESYVEALKSENESLKTSANASDPHESTDTAPNSTKKTAELEKTVFVLKRVVEKLQAENKRLLGGNRLCTLGDRSSTADQLRRDFNRIKQQYGASVQKAARLEQELNQANSKIKSLESKETTASTSTLSNELYEVKSQLAQKSALLDQVKFLLQKAAVREKLLQEEVHVLKRQLLSSQPERDA